MSVIDGDLLTMAAGLKIEDLVEGTFTKRKPKPIQSDASFAATIYLALATMLW